MKRVAKELGENLTDEELQVREQLLLFIVVKLYDITKKLYFIFVTFSKRVQVVTFCFIGFWLKITNSKKIDAAPKNDAGGDGKHLFFYLALEGQKNTQLSIIS